MKINQKIWDTEIVWKFLGESFNFPFQFDDGLVLIPQSSSSCWSVWTPSACVYLFFLCLFPRVLQRAPGERWEVSERHVCADVRPAVHAELGAVQGPLCGAEALLRERQCQPGGDAQRVLGTLAGAHVPAGEPPVPLHGRVPGVCQQVHGAAEALRGRAAQAQAASDASLCGRPHLRAGPGRRQGRHQQSVCGELCPLSVPVCPGAVMAASLSAVLYLKAVVVEHGWDPALSV